MNDSPNGHPSKAVAALLRATIPTVIRSAHFLTTLHVDLREYRPEGVDDDVLMLHVFGGPDLRLLSGIPHPYHCGPTIRCCERRSKTAPSLHSAFATKAGSEVEPGSEQVILTPPARALSTPARVRQVRRATCSARTCRWSTSRAVERAVVDLSDLTKEQVAQ